MFGKRGPFQQSIDDNWTNLLSALFKVDQSDLLLPGSYSARLPIGAWGDISHASLHHDIHDAPWYLTKILPKTVGSEAKKNIFSIKTSVQRDFYCENAI